MNCPQCGRRGAEVYEGEQAHKLNTAFCEVCGRVPLPLSEPVAEPEAPAEAAEAVVEPEAPEGPPAAPAEAEEPEDQEESSLVSSHGRRHR